GKQAADRDGLLTRAVVGCGCANLDEKSVAGCVTQGGRSPTEVANPATARSRGRAARSGGRGVGRIWSATPARPGRRHGPTVRAAILVKPGEHSRVLLAETLRRDG